MFVTEHKHPVMPTKNRLREFFVGDACALRAPACCGSAQASLTPPFSVSCSCNSPKNTFCLSGLYNMCKIRILFEPAIIQFTLFLSVIQPLYDKTYHVAYTNQMLTISPPASSLWAVDGGNYGTQKRQWAGLLPMGSVWCHP